MHKGNGVREEGFSDAVFVCPVFLFAVIGKEKEQKKRGKGNE